MGVAGIKRYQLRSLPSRGAWIEMGMTGGSSPASLSLPSRGAWIEIQNHLLSG